MMVLLTTMETLERDVYFCRKDRKLKSCQYRRNKWATGVKLTMACLFDRWAAAESIVMLH